MINFNSEIDFELKNPTKLSRWISETILDEKFKEGEINYIFCSDTYLHKLNVDFLKHDNFTDIISFDYSIGKELHGDLYISIDRVRENALKFNELFEDELARVMIHGVLHYCGYKDKFKEDKREMRAKEDYYLLRRI